MLNIVLVSQITTGWWLINNQHKLIPSVYAGIRIECDGLGNKEAVGYLSPTYIAISSGKHLSSTAVSHGLDFETLLDLKEVEDITIEVELIDPKSVLCYNC